MDLTDLNKLFPAPVMARALPRPASSSSGVSSYLNYAIRIGLSAVKVAQGVLNGAIATVEQHNSTAVPTHSAEAAVAVVDEQGAGETSSASSAPAEVSSTVSADGTLLEVKGGTTKLEELESATPVVAEPAKSEVPLTATTESSETAVASATAAERSPLQMATSVQFASFRSSQLVSVGFPIDHAAVVWCYDLLHVVSGGIKRMSKLNSNATIDWTEVFPQAPFNTSAHVGTYEYHMSVRQQAKKRWAEASSNETMYLSSKFPTRFLFDLPFAFVSHHLLKIVACYIVVCCLALFAPMVRVLTGNSDALAPINASNWDSLLLGNQFSLDLVGAAVFSALRTSIPPPMWKHMFSMVYQLVAIAVLIKAAYDYFFGTFAVSTYIEVAYWMVAYFLAIVVRAVLLTTVQVIHRICGAISSTVRIVLRYTVWNQTIRRSVRSCFKSSNKFCKQKIPFYATCVLFLQRSVAPTAVTSIWMAVYLTSQHRLHEGENLPALGRVTFGLSVLVVVAYAIMALGLLLALVSPLRNSAAVKGGVSTPNSCFVDLTLLYLPVPVVALPTFFYSIRLLYGAAVVFPSAASLFGVFDVDRALYCLAVAAVGSHLLIARSTWCVFFFADRCVESFLICFFVILFFFSLYF